MLQIRTMSMLFVTCKFIATGFSILLISTSVNSEAKINKDSVLLIAN